MKYKILFSQVPPFILLFLFLSLNSRAQMPGTDKGIPEVPAFKLFLVGDAGEGDTTGAALLDLKAQLLANPNSAVIFLGDNCYLKSFFLLPVETGGFNGSKVAIRRMMSQLDILTGYKGFACFIPGNHDWWNHQNLKKGKNLLLAEQKFVEDTLRTFNALQNHEEGTFLPTNGSPGPVARVFNEGKIRIVFMDTYRLIMAEAGNNPEDSILLNTFFGELKRQLTEASERNEKIIMVGHHPIRSAGKHSKPLPFWQKLSKRFADSNTNYPPYHRMIVRLDSLLKEQHYPGIYYVSGHEHSLEYFYSDSMHYIVSGAGSKIDEVEIESCSADEQCLRWNEAGFFEIDFYGEKEKVLMYHRKDSRSDVQVQCVAGCK